MLVYSYRTEFAFSMWVLSLLNCEPELELYALISRETRSLGKKTNNTDPRLATCKADGLLNSNGWMLVMEALMWVCMELLSVRRGSLLSDISPELTENIFSHRQAPPSERENASCSVLFYILHRRRLLGMSRTSPLEHVQNPRRKGVFFCFFFI